MIRADTTRTVLAIRTVQSAYLVKSRNLYVINLGVMHLSSSCVDLWVNIITLRYPMKIIPRAAGINFILFKLKYIRLRPIFSLDIGLQRYRY